MPEAQSGSTWVNTMKQYTDTKQLVRDIDRISTSAAINSEMNAALERWSINGFIDITSIDPSEKSYEYTPETRQYSFGDVSPMSCRSNPSYTDGAPQQPQRIFTYPHEIALNVCYTECQPDTLEEILRKKWRQQANAFGKFLWDVLWVGRPEHLIYGITNHPLALDKGPLTVGATSGSTAWAGKTPDEIIADIVALIWDFETPIISISRRAYFDAFGKSFGSDCNAMLTCLNKILQSMPDVNFSMDQLRIVDGLDGLDPAFPDRPHHNFGTLTPIGGGADVDTTNLNFMTCHDAGAVGLRASGMQAMGAGQSENTKYAKQINWMATQGLVISQTDSVRVRWEV